MFSVAPPSHVPVSVRVSPPVCRPDVMLIALTLGAGIMLMKTEPSLSPAEYLCATKQRPAREEEKRERCRHTTVELTCIYINIPISLYKTIPPACKTYVLTTTA